MKKIWIILLFINLTAYGQELKITAEPNPAIVGEQILIQYSIDAKVDDFSQPKFNGLQILSGPNPSTQTNYTFINGKSENKTISIINSSISPKSRISYLNSRTIS